MQFFLNRHQQVDRIVTVAQGAALEFLNGVHVRVFLAQFKQFFLVAALRNNKVYVVEAEVDFERHNNLCRGAQPPLPRLLNDR